MKKQYWKEILPKVLELKAQGYSYRMAAEELGYTHKQIKKLIERHNRNQRKPVQLPAKLGRPRTRAISTEEEYQVRIKQLEMENDLLRSFLQAAGRM